MRYLGYIAPLPKRKRGDIAHYAPTESFVASWRAHMRAALEAARIVEPGVSPVLDRLGERAVLNRVSRLQGEGLLKLAQRSDQGDAFVRVFMHPHAGNQIVWTLLAADDEFPPRGPLPFSIGAAAQEFGVSRTHIRRMIDAATREGLIAVGESGTVIFTPSARQTLVRHFAIQLAQLLSAAAAALEFDEAPKQRGGNAPEMSEFA
jgi:hypothetical protein